MQVLLQTTAILYFHSNIYEMYIDTLEMKILFWFIFIIISCNSKSYSDLKKNFINIFRMCFPFFNSRIEFQQAGGKFLPSLLNPACFSLPSYSSLSVELRHTFLSFSSPVEYILFGWFHWWFSLSHLGLHEAEVRLNSLQP